MVFGPHGYATLISGSALGITMLTNGLMKRPYFYRPWRHAVAMGAGYYFGYQTGIVNKATHEVATYAKESIAPL
eukprot:CAMPEP_0197685426 /NCGR_PEP_ID=MMETSP1338-20131121/100919_1 /TAXON_ID=43686 ORGANISM="Pelagodinium beii, Strain RCC1491" /NCGR_SAMPLE_ID=MMETSP1338 /ASSEMBLY_ACC=CAM_ASM_000754 /LENGTH=73 /DNA_ID=CAMNT_0043267243 /DNA_START=10 /DNA_END=228 /DNA_ORIENTATION=-